jgi:L-seryl-tRNA(Ser) seleniumtransferase
MTDPRSRIPAIDRLLASEPFSDLLARYPRTRLVDATRKVVDNVRGAIGGGVDVEGLEAPERYARAVEACLAAEDLPSLRRVINATGVVLHTNLGRAPLAEAAVRAMADVAHYANLEYDLGAGSRGSRYVHCVSLLTSLTGGEDALVVNNAAAGLILALNTVARGGGVAVSRGELVEIGGGFRIPEILERAGARLVEVGSTNRTRAADYRDAVRDTSVDAILKVHRSNFRISGFTEEATLVELAALAREAGVPLIHDLGSGLLIDPERLGLPAEPRPMESLADGADVVVFSGDKLLGGPQAGVVVGARDVVSQMRSNPLCRAVRVDKVTLAALEATLGLYRDVDRALREIPVLRMLATPESEIRERCEHVAGRLGKGDVDCSVVRTGGAVGGGTFPGVEIASWALALPAGGRPNLLADHLRDGSPPVVGRVVDDRLLLDLRTVALQDEEALVSRTVQATARAGPPKGPHVESRAQAEEDG